jgi:DNA repair exonuclease SbcCD ATPase subunit
MARFNDGRVQPAERLSSGQKVVMALSFRLAVNFMYADLGFLVLDEPTAYLDEHHIAGFEPVLGCLREFAASRGLQCLMVTHEQSLAPLFDSVLQL